MALEDQQTGTHDSDDPGWFGEEGAMQAPQQEETLGPSIAIQADAAVAHLEAAMSKLHNDIEALEAAQSRMQAVQVMGKEPLPEVTEGLSDIDRKTGELRAQLNDASYKMTELMASINAARSGYPHNLSQLVAQAESLTTQISNIRVDNTIGQAETDTKKALYEMQMEMQISMAEGYEKLYGFERIFEIQDRARDYYHAMLNEYGDFDRATTDATYEAVQGLLGDRHAEAYKKYKEGAQIIDYGIAKHTSPQEANRITEAAKDENDAKAKKHVDEVLGSLSDSKRNNEYLQRLLNTHIGVLPAPILDYIENFEGNDEDFARGIKELAQEHNLDMLIGIYSRFKSIGGTHSAYVDIREGHLDDNGMFDKEKLRETYFDLAAKLKEIKENNPDISPEQAVKMLSPEDQQRYNFLTAATIEVQSRTAGMVLDIISKDKELAQTLDQSLKNIPPGSSRADTVYEVLVRQVAADNPELEKKLRNNPAFEAYIKQNADRITDGQSAETVLREASEQENISFITREESYDRKRESADTLNKVADDKLNSWREEGSQYQELMATIDQNGAGYIPRELSDLALDSQLVNISDKEIQTRLETIARDVTKAGNQIRTGAVQNLKATNPELFKHIRKELAEQGINTFDLSNVERIDLEKLPTLEEFNKAYYEFKEAKKNGETVSPEVAKTYALGRLRGEITQAATIGNVINGINFAQKNGSSISPEQFARMSHAQRMELMESYGIIEEATYEHAFFNTVSKNITEDQAMHLIGLSDEIKQANERGDEKRVQEIGRKIYDIVNEAAGIDSKKTRQFSEEYFRQLNQNKIEAIAAENNAVLSASRVNQNYSSAAINRSVTLDPETGNYIDHDRQMSLRGPQMSKRGIPTQSSWSDAQHNSPAVSVADESGDILGTGNISRMGIGGRPANDNPLAGNDNSPSKTVTGQLKSPHEQAAEAAKPAKEAGTGAAQDVSDEEAAEEKTASTATAKGPDEKKEAARA